jgi:putative hemolysin
VILTPWATLGQFVHRHGVQSVIGCASVPMPDGGINAAALWHELSCGAKVLGAPAWDPDFGCADLPLLLRWQDLSPSYRRHFVTV